MSHSPPVPPANQSPYPLAEPAHDHHHAAVAQSVLTSNPSKIDPATGDRRVKIGIAAALGIGVIAALVAGIVASRQSHPAPKRKKANGRKKR